MKNEKANKVISSILRVIPVAMAAAVVVLTALGQIGTEVCIIMLAIGMFAGGLERMRQEQ